MARKKKKGQLTPKQKKDHVKNNLGLVDFTIKKYFSWTGILDKENTDNYFLLEYNDLFNEGVLGLMRASELFDTTREVKFSTFSTNYIRLYIQKGIFACGTRVFRYPNGIHRLKEKIDITCRETHLSYLQLYENGTISLEVYLLLGCISMLNRYVNISDMLNEYKQVFSHDEMFTLITNEDSRLFYKEVVKKLVGKCFVFNKDRNYRIICMKLGLDQYKMLSNSKIRKEIKPTISTTTIQRIVTKFFDFFRANISIEQLIN